MDEHKASAQKDGQPRPVSRHFKNDGHSHRHMQFSLLEWSTPKFEASMTAKRRRIELDLQITLSSANWHQPICVILHGYYLDNFALNCPSSLFLKYFLSYRVRKEISAAVAA